MNKHSIRCFGLRAPFSYFISLSTLFFFTTNVIKMCFSWSLIGFSSFQLKWTAHDRRVKKSTNRISSEIELVIFSDRTEPKPNQIKPNKKILRWVFNFFNSNVFANGTFMAKFDFRFVVQKKEQKINYNFISSA